ncbi:hypothetical protein [Pseudodesulfovibrio sp.]|uniref:hypothetical protein n=1 Tax=Pseudodesulfovibrio sp. TaxID=2035812 RepID=UPI00260DCF61|nr:hypothetical protein [Pseudodesulfovibrio sp.]MDD3310981.1 hypothetical protein [Pseudodesulfovibrio sp.]
MHTLPAPIQDFIAANFPDQNIRDAKTQAALDTYACLWADERGDMYPEDLASDVCQALLSDGDDMVIKLSVAVRDCINREDDALSSRSDGATPEPALVPEISAERGAELAHMQNDVALADKAVLDAEEVHKALGRIEGMEFLRRVGDVAIAQVFEDVRKSKKYKGLPYHDESGNLRHVEDFDDFCKVKLGKSYTRCYELSRNLHVLGSDLYESAERIGFRSKDYRALNALPADDQAVVKQALASESRDEVLSILEDLASDVCQALLSDGDDMVIKLSVAVRDCINREDDALSSRSDGATPEPALVPEISAERGAELAHMQNDVALADKAVLDAEEVHKALGRIEGMEFLRRVGDVAIAQVFEDVRKSKKYKGLPYHDESGNLRHVEDFDDFCKVKLGKSYTRCYELSRNLHVLGSDLYESAERIGFRSKDYRALNALPADDQAVVKQALASESRDEVLSILEDLAAKHQAEREAAKREKADLAADLEARGKLLEDKAARLERTETELYKLKSLPPDEQTALRLAREEEAVNQLNTGYMEALSRLNEYLRRTAVVLAADGVSEHTTQYAVGQVRALCEEINGTLLTLGIPVDFGEIISPAWLREAAQADLDDGRIAEPGAAGRSW